MADYSQDWPRHGGLDDGGIILPAMGTVHNDEEVEPAYETLVRRGRGGWMLSPPEASRQAEVCLPRDGYLVVIVALRGGSVVAVALFLQKRSRHTLSSVVVLSLSPRRSR